MSNEPLIWTTKGNLPESELDYTQAWENHIGADVSLHMKEGALVPAVKHTGYITFVETYKLKGTDEVVKQNVHVCSMAPPEFVDIEQGNVGT